MYKSNRKKSLKGFCLCSGWCLIASFGIGLSLLCVGVYFMWDTIKPRNASNNSETTELKSDEVSPDPLSAFLDSKKEIKEIEENGFIMYPPSVVMRRNPGIPEEKYVAEDVEQKISDMFEDLTRAKNVLCDDINAMLKVTNPNESFERAKSIKNYSDWIRDAEKNLDQKLNHLRIIAGKSFRDPKLQELRTETTNVRDYNAFMIMNSMELKRLKRFETQFTPKMTEWYQERQEKSHWMFKQFIDEISDPKKFEEQMKGAVLPTAKVPLPKKLDKDEQTALVKLIINLRKSFEEFYKGDTGYLKKSKFDRPKYQIDEKLNEKFEKWNLDGMWLRIRMISINDGQRDTGLQGITVEEYNKFYPPMSELVHEVRNFIAGNPPWNGALAPSFLERFEKRYKDLMKNHWMTF